MRNFNLFLFLIISHYTFSQSRGVVTYKSSTNISTATATKAVQKEEVAQLLTMVDNAIGKNEFILYFENRISYFKVKEKILLDSQQDKMISNLATKLLSRGVYFVDSSKDQIINQFEDNGITFLIENKISSTKWTLTNEMKKISNYICYKATTIFTVNNSSGLHEIPVTAWYTPKIPIPFGPKNYGGLPGLILELQERNIIFYASTIELKPTEKFNIIKPEKGTKITETEYQKKSSESLTNFKELIGN